PLLKCMQRSSTWCHSCLGLRGSDGEMSCTTDSLALNLGTQLQCHVFSSLFEGDEEKKGRKNPPSRDWMKRESPEAICLELRGSSLLH
ncbi:hypothetical protein CRENBAI_016385, partial [Crenichthys baileyi]